LRLHYRANFHFVQHVLEMDTTFPGNPLLWRSLRWGPLQHGGDFLAQIHLIW
jgi:predicted small integral membrane protein